MYVHIGIIGRVRTTQLSLALFVIISDSVTLGERAYNNYTLFVSPFDALDPLLRGGESTN